MNIRVPRQMWAAYGRVCARLGRDRTEDLLAHTRVARSSATATMWTSPTSRRPKPSAPSGAGRKGGRPPKTGVSW